MYNEQEHMFSIYVRALSKYTRNAQRRMHVLLARNKMKSSIQQPAKLNEREETKTYLRMKYKLIKWCSS